jgi:hypothetical protein
LREPNKCRMGQKGEHHAQLTHFEAPEARVWERSAATHLGGLSHRRESPSDQGSKDYDGLHTKSTQLKAFVPSKWLALPLG